MVRPVEARLVELRRHELAWPFVAYAIVTGTVRADADLLFTKNFGHSVFRWINVLFPDDIARLEDAAARLGAATPRVAVRGAVQLAVAFAGRAPATLTIEDLDQLVAEIDTSPRLSEPMRRGRREICSGFDGSCSKPAWSRCRPSTAEKVAPRPAKHGSRWCVQGSSDGP